MHWIWPLVARLSNNKLCVRGPGQGGAIYLTFDDGPNAQHTPALLDLLKAHDAKATFFTIGRDAQAHPELVQRLLAEGHALGNHSMTHARLKRMAPAQQQAEVKAADAVLQGFTGRAHHPFRPPHGEATFSMLWRMLRGQQRLVLWSVDSLDYCLEAGAVVQRLQDWPLSGGDILLFHDDGPVATEALAQLLPAWRSRGLTLAAL